MWIIYNRTGSHTCQEIVFRIANDIISKGFDAIQSPNAMRYLVAARLLSVFLSNAYHLTLTAHNDILISSITLNQTSWKPTLLFLANKNYAEMCNDMIPAQKNLPRTGRLSMTIRLLATHNAYHTDL